MTPAGRCVASPRWALGGAAFGFVGGAARLVPDNRMVPDNLKTGVDGPDLHDPKISRS